MPNPGGTVVRGFRSFRKRYANRQQLGAAARSLRPRIPSHRYNVAKNEVSASFRRFAPLCAIVGEAPIS